MTCRACGQEEETQNHILHGCNALYQNNENKVNQADFFTNDITQLKQTAKKINLTLN